MSSYPLLHMPTSVPVSPGGPSHRGTGDIFGNPPEHWETEDTYTKALSHKTYQGDLSLLVGIIVMLMWPWVFFGVIWLHGGVRLNNHIVKVVMDNPRDTAYFITLIGSIISMIVSCLFSLAITRFSQEWVTNQSPVQVFHVTVLSAMRNQNWPWGLNIESLRQLFDRKRWWPATLLIFCITIFALVTSTTTSLITPISFNRAAPLTGTEFDFLSSAPDCLAWSNGTRPDYTCDWQRFRGMEYSTCVGEGQLVDILESGRGKILELLSGKPQSLIFSQLGPNSLPFLGSIRGALPIGPNGVPAFNNMLQNSPFSDPEIRAAMISYNYTLEHQGLNINVSCNYDTQSPIVYSPIDQFMGMAIQYNSSCDGLAQALTNVSSLIAVNVDSILLFWACQSSPNTEQASSYFIYLRGFGPYVSAIGNITCTLSPSQHAIFPLMYQSTPGTFSSQNWIATNASSNSNSGSLLNVLVEGGLLGLVSLMMNAQSWSGHQIAELAGTFGVQSFGLPPSVQATAYLHLYEAIIQGILEYEATYLRMIYSTALDAPPSCRRNITGQLSYQVIGWSVQAQNIGYLLPMTLINLASLGILIWAMLRPKTSGTKFNPTDAREILYFAHVQDDPAVPSEWVDRVAFSKAKVIRDDF